MLNRAKNMINEGLPGAPQSQKMLLAVVVGFVVIVLFSVNDEDEDEMEASTSAISELISPISHVLLPIVLLLLIHFLSSDRTSLLSGIFSTAEPHSIHRLTGSSLGLALLLLFVLFVLYNRLYLLGSLDDH